MKVRFIKTRFHSLDVHDLDSVWQLLYPEHFINVLLIHHLKRRDQKDIEEVANIMYYNDSISIPFKVSTSFKHLPRLLDDQLYHKKFKVFEISDMFESFQDEDGSIIDPKFILIDGAPGMGKTTLCKEIACQWAKGDLLKDTKMVFLLFLCEPEVQNMYDLNDFLQYFFKLESSNQDLDLTSCCVERFIRDNNSDVTILMDGYDELGDKGNNLLVTKILRRKILPQCRIVITSRPIASEKLQKLADVRVEVLGFTDDSKKEYIQKELKDDPKKAEHLLSYLDSHSDVNKACYVPIIMSIMVCIYNYYDELPINQSEVYEMFVTLVMSHYLRTQGVLSLDKLPLKYRAYFQQLAEFAFKTIKGDKVMFSYMDIERFSHAFALSSAELCGLGLFNITERFSLKKKNNVKWYNFLHLSIHEFLAAFYVKSLEISEQFKLLEQHFFAQHYLNIWILFVNLQQNFTYNFHHLLIYSHIYGICDAPEDEMKLILKKLHLFHFSEIQNININNIEGTYQFLCCKTSENNLQTDVTRENFIKTFDSLCLLSLTSNWTKLFISLCSVTNTDQLVEIYLLDKNTQDVLYHQVVAELEQNHNLSVTLVSSDTLVGYRCNCCQLFNALNMNGSLATVILKYCQINDDVANVLSSYLTKSHNFKCLYITDCSDQLALLLVIQSLRRLSTIKYLVLDNNKMTSNNMTGEVTEDLANVIKSNSHLEQLGLANNNLGPFAIVILQALKKNTKLQILNLDNNNMTAEVAEDLANVITSNFHLERLGLANNNLGPSAFVLLQALKENTKLQILNLNNNNMTGEVAEDLANIIKSNSYLEQLGLGNNNLGPSAIVILQALKENSKLKILDLNSNKMTAEVAEDLANVIKNNLDLEELYLSNNSLGSSAIMILQALKENFNLQILNLDYNNMTGEVAEDLANIIKSNSYLEQLGLGNNNLGPSAIVILQALKGNSKIKILDLDNNNMTAEVTEDLANVIKNNLDLEELYLSNNSLGSSAIVILQAFREHSKLKILDLNSNKMTAEVAEDLANVIKNNLDLEELYLSNNSLGSSAIVILQAFRENSKLKILDLDSNKMTADVAKDLANVIKNNLDLEELYLSDNSLGSSVVMILQALKENSNLHILKLYCNNMTGEVAEDLANIIKSNSYLEQLGLGNNNLGPSAIVILQALKENSKLKILDIDSNNMTGEVAEDLANIIKSNSYLEQLGLGNNNLGSSAIVILQALKGNSKIKILYLDNNNMNAEVTEDLANVIKNNLDLEELFLSNNSLGSSAIVILQALKENSKLKILDLNSNKMTAEVAEDLANVIKNNLDLEELFLSNNSLGSSAIVILQALKENSKLKILDLNSNKMTAEVAEDLANVIKNNLDLEKLYLSNNSLGSSAIMILQALKENFNLQILNLDYNNMTGEVAEDLANIIKSNSYLEQLGLGNNNLGPSAIVILQALKENSKLQILNLNNNNMTGEVAEDLANIIKSNSHLKRLGLGNNNLGPCAFIVLQALKENSKLQLLNLDHNNMTGVVAEDLANVIKSNSHLERLGLGNNNLGPSAIVILQALKENSKLKILDLDSNNMTGVVAEDLANVIKSNSHLERLGLGNNSLGSSAIMILQALKENSKLQMLNLDNNNMTEEVIEDLANVIKCNSRLEGLGLGNNYLGPSTNVILQALKENLKLKVLDLDSNNTTAEVAEDLANVIKSNSHLERLGLGNNNLGPSAIVILQALKENSKLQMLNLDNNNMTEEVAEDLANVIKSNSHLKQLKLGNNNLGPFVFVILQALKDNSNLQLLTLFKNNMTGEVVEDLASVIKSNSHLEQLELGNNNLGPSAIVILQALKENSKLQILNLDSNNITGEVAEDLANVIKSNSHLEQLGLGNNNLGPSVIIILQALKENSKLQILNLANNNMTGEVAEDLANVIKSNSRLEQLGLGNNNLGPSVIVILKALKENSKLQILNLDYNNMTGEVAEDLTSVIKSNSHLKRLGLGNNNLGPFAFVVLQALKENSKLQILNLDCNNMTGEVAEDLANVIKSNSHLKQLRLDNNNLGPSAIVILQALKESSKLKILDLDNNKMTAEVAEDLANVIKNNLDLEELYLSNNSLGPSAIMILQALKENFNLQIMNLDYNNMTGELAEDLANVIKSNSYLEQLGLGNNNLGPSAIVILQALKENSKLKILDLDNNKMTAEVAEDLANVIKNNLDLEELYLSNNSLGSSAIVILQALKENSKLQILSLTNNNMTGEVAEELGYVIKNNLNLEELYLSNNSLGSSAIVTLQALKENSNLQVLNLDHNNMTRVVAEDLANVIKSTSHLDRLGLGNYNLGPSAIVILQALKENSKLQILNLNNNNMTGEVAEDLTNVIKNNPGFEELYLSNNSLGPSAIMVFQALKENSSLQILNLINNNMTGEVAVHLVDVIKWNPGLEEFYISSNNLGSFAILILQTLKENSKLKALDLANFKLTGQVAEDLVSVIKNNPHLENFYLVNNNLKSSEFLILQALKENCKLKILQISNDSLAESAVVELVAIVKNNPLVTELWLGDNMLQSGLIDIAVNCKSLANFQSLELSHSNICPTKAVYLASIVGNINLLQILIFGGIVLNIQEVMHYGIFQFYDTSKNIQKHILQNNCTNNNALVELICLEMWRSLFAHRIKFIHAHDYFSISSNMLTNFFYAMPTLSDTLSVVKHSEQKLSQLDATRIIIFF